MHFRDAAELYEAYRDRYPTALIDWMAEALGKAAGGHVLDLAAGTGFLARALAGRVRTIAATAAITAIDESLDMIEAGRRGGGDVGVRWVLARSPLLPLRPRSFDAVVIGNAVHWLSRELPARELAALLRPGAVAVYVTRSHFFIGPEPWKARVQEVLRELFPESSARFDAEVAPNIGGHEPYLEPPFQPVDDRIFPGEYSATAEELAGFLLSTSLLAAERSTTPVEELGERIAAAVEPLLAGGLLTETIRYRCTVARLASDRPACDTLPA